MGDIHVHVRLQACCRETLAKLDEKKKACRATTGLLAVGSLVTWLGASPVDVAAQELAGLAASRGRGAPGPADAPTALEAVAAATCRKLCELHARDHAAKGENEEARFWRAMAEGF